MPTIDVVIPTYTRHDKLKACLQSLIDYCEPQGCNVIVVANGASDETRHVFTDFERRWQGKATLLWYDSPLGYPISVNHGIRAGNGEFVVLLNDDAQFLPQPLNWCMETMFQPMLDDGGIGVTGPLEEHDPNSNHNFLIFFCVMIRRQCFNEVGLLDEEFRYFGEDTDFCIRAERRGWKVVRVPVDHPTSLMTLDPATTTLEPWKHDKFHTGQFYIFHDAESTIGHLPEADEVLRESRARLKMLYDTDSDVDIHRAMVTDGWIAHDELLWLARAAKACGPNARIAQVGTWHGKSSRALSDNMCEGSKLFDVDTFNGSSGEPDQHATAKEREGDHCFQWYWDNQYEQILKGEVIPMRMHSHNAAHTLNHRGIKFDMVFIDADHTHQGVRDDIAAWAPLVKDGGLICGHDYYTVGEEPFAWIGVRETVEEMFPDAQKVATSIWWSRSKPIERKPAVYDCFPFNDELDLLELRFHELDGVVDRFVITEAPLTHSGNAKPLHFQDNLERFAPWLHKVTHIVVDDFDHIASLTGPDRHWAIERHQRDALMRGLGECKDDDIIIISDTDEIPRATAVASYDPNKGLCALEMKLYYGSMNCEGLEPWTWTRMLPYRLLRDTTPCAVRYNWGFDKPNYDVTIPNAGWHFSFLGTPDEWVKKLEDTPHQEYNKPEFKDKAVMLDRVRNGRDLLGRDIPYRLVEVDDTFPLVVQQNIKQFEEKQFIMHPEVIDYIERVKSQHPTYFVGKRVLEVGSLIINGTPRVHFEGCAYLGIDLQEGDGVDTVAAASTYIRPNTFDVVVCTEVLEHDRDWETSLRQMYANLAPNGLLLITCAGPTRPEHGTTRTDTYSSPFTTDYYRNISKEDLLGVLPTELFSECEIGYQRGLEDLHFYGIKRDAQTVFVPNAAKSITEIVNERGPLVGMDTVTFDVPNLATTKHWTVTACVNTRDRYFTTLPMCLASIAAQSHKPDKLKIYDDGDQADLRGIPPYDQLLAMLTNRGIDWEIVHTPRKGQVTNHQHCLDNATTDFIWRVDDDELAMPDTLERLLNTVRDYGRGEFENIGAVGGLVLMPGEVNPPPDFLNGTLSDIDAGMNLQWFKLPLGVKGVEHLYSSFLYRVPHARKVGGYPSNLSQVGHREESILTHKLHRGGFKLLIDPVAVTYHLRQATGGIRSVTDHSLWEADERVWQSYRAEWGMNGPKPHKLIVLDLGIGDHLLFKGIWNEIVRRNPDTAYTLALCYPEVFANIPNLQIISIADAKTIVGDRYDDYSFYKWAWMNEWKGSVVDAMLEFYG